MFPVLFVNEKVKLIVLALHSPAQSNSAKGPRRRGSTEKRRMAILLPPNPETEKVLGQADRTT